MILTIGILITANSVSAAPQGTVIKEGVLTYPAGPYLSGDPLLLSLGNYTGDNDTEGSGEQFKIAYLENEHLFFENSSQSSASESLTVCEPGVCPHRFFDTQLKFNKETLHTGFRFIFYPVSLSINRLFLSSIFNTAF